MQYHTCGAIVGTLISVYCDNTQVSLEITPDDVSAEVFILLGEEGGCDTS